MEPCVAYGHSQETTDWAILEYEGFVQYYNIPHGHDPTCFKIIITFLQNDNAQWPPQDNPTFDDLFKVRPVTDHLSAKFAEVYILKNSFL